MPLAWALRQSVPSSACKVPERRRTRKAFCHILSDRQVVTESRKLKLTRNMPLPEMTKSWPIAQHSSTEIHKVHAQSSAYKSQGALASTERDVAVGHLIFRFSKKKLEDLQILMLSNSDRCLKLSSVLKSIILTLLQL